MATLTLTIPDTDVAQRAIDLGYATLAQQGETQGQFLSRRVKEILRQSIINGQMQNAQMASMQNLPIVIVT